MPVAEIGSSSLGSSIPALDKISLTMSPDEAASPVDCALVPVF